MLKLIYPLTKAKMHRRFNRPAFPYKVNLHITYSCNSRCKACFIWKKYRKRPGLKKKELTANDWKEFFEKLNGDLYWLSISGGEPFLRKDLAEIVTSIENKNLRLFSMNTNGYLTEKIYGDVRAILESLDKKTKFFLAVSLYGSEKTHNTMTGMNSYRNAERTYELLRGLENDHKNFRVERELLITRHNLKEIKDLTTILNTKKIPFVLVLAQESEFYENVGNDTYLPSKEKRELIDILKSVEIPLYNNKDVIKRVFKKLLIKSLEKSGQPIPCYSTWSSVRIDPYGNVYPCIMKNEIIENLKGNGMDLKKVLENPKLRNIQKGIKNKECSCWTPCEAYQSIVQNLPFV